MKLPLFKRIALLCVVFALCTGLGPTRPEISALVPRAEFLTEVNGEVSPYRIRSAFVMPGETLTVAAGVPFHLLGEAGTVRREAEEASIWTAPQEPGTYTLYLSPEKNYPEVTIHVFVLVPADQIKRGKLKGYAIGNYPKGEGVYEKPRGFIQVNAEDEDLWVSPHFQLKQFLCKQSAAFPKFVLLREKLLIKLERILEKLHERGFNNSSITVVSGYRTPSHNRPRGKRNSRHLWGDAADIFVDGAPQDGRMDDLNKDGKSNWKDTAILQEIVQEMETDEPHLYEVGGLGLYRNTRGHGPFVHVDARGTSARWGVRPAKRKKSRT
ncbi:hypothetical protein K2X33_12025 [bacterium]|nr:hypothetical protein [bacterium]